MTPHHFCCILFGQAIGFSYTQGEVISEDRIVGTILESVCHITRWMGRRDHARCNLSDDTQSDMAFEEGEGPRICLTALQPSSI